MLYHARESNYRGGVAAPPIFWVLLASLFVIDEFGH
jgi:hypothetical protein